MELEFEFMEERVSFKDLPYPDLSYGMCIDECLAIALD